MDITRLYGVAMKYDYKMVNIYIDKNGTLYVVPTGESKKFGGAIVDLDLIVKLDFPYSDNDLENSLMRAIEDCFSIEPNVSLSVSALERFLNIKGFSKAVKDKRLVILEWNCDEGYFFLPTKKLTKQGFEHLESEKIYVGKKLIKGVLSKKFMDAIKLSK